MLASSAAARIGDLFADQPVPGPTAAAITTAYACLGNEVPVAVRSSATARFSSPRSPNIGWTPIFPRAAAVVTDVGAPLSHAAIVARELGIPAVVGCGNATMLVHSGDRIRVDGGTGTVELLHQA
jgi:phosphoenolpyruvate synthase/pyruvate phosphate dikinase